MQKMQPAERNVLAFCKHIKFEAMFGSNMRTLFAILGLLLCLSPARADELIAMLQGKIIGITGTIELYQGKPEIKVISIDQIKGLP